MHQPSPDPARRRPHLFGKPAVKALLLQLAAAPISLAALWLAARGGFPLGVLSAAFLHGAVAALLSTWRGLAPWWLLIQALFVPALVATLALGIDPLWFLGAFAILLPLYWSTFRTQVPYYPSGKAVWSQVDSLLPAGRPLRVIDIGSGLGGFVLDLALRRPEVQAVGIELAPLPWLLSWLRARLSGSSARFIRGDYEDLDFGQFDAVFAYLSPAAMSALWRKASQEMRPGSMLLSFEFLITERTPDLDIPTRKGGPRLYVWHF